MKCVICKVEKGRNNSLLKHLREDHKNLDNEIDKIKLSNQIRELESGVDLKCEFCHTTFKRKDNLRFHVENSCKKNIVGQVEKLLQYASHEEICKIHDLVSKMKKNPPEEERKQQSTIYNQNANTHIEGNNNKVDIRNNNIINNINQTDRSPLIENVELFDEFKESLGSVSGGEYAALRSYDMNQRYEAFLKLFEFLHFNVNIPENHNIYVPNKKIEDYMVLIKDKWTRTRDPKYLENLFRLTWDFYIKVIEDMVDKGIIADDSIDYELLKAEVKNNPRLSPKLSKDMLYLGYRFKDIVQNSKTKFDLNRALF